MLRKFKEVGKKKVAIIVAAAVLSVSALGGTTYAYKDIWTEKITKGVALLAHGIFKNDIEAAIATHGNQKEAELTSWGDQFIRGVVQELNTYKANEITRGKSEIDAKFNNDKARLTEAANNALAAEKAKQKTENDAAINKEQADLDAIVDNALNQIPDGK